jgi:hypothetical protein
MLTVRRRRIGFAALKDDLYLLFQSGEAPGSNSSRYQFWYIYSEIALAHPEDERMLKPRRVPAIWCPAKKQMKN